MKLNQKQFAILTTDEYMVLEYIAKAVYSKYGNYSSNPAGARFTCLESEYARDYKVKYFEDGLKKYKDTTLDIDMLINFDADDYATNRRYEIINVLENDKKYIKVIKTPVRLGHKIEYMITEQGWEYINANMNMNKMYKICYLKGTDKQRRYAYFIRKNLLSFIEIAREQILNQYMLNWENDSAKRVFDNELINKQMDFIDYAIRRINLIPDAKTFLDNFYELGNSKKSMYKLTDYVRESCNKQPEDFWKIVYKLSFYIDEKYKI